jgi:ferrous iron transport protein B
MHHGLRIKVIDLPGIYSFSIYSPEELLTREYILTRHPDAVINVVDATSLERNLYFTLQLKEMQAPVVMALNFADIAKKKHIYLDTAKLSRILDVPVVSTIGTKGLGVHNLVDAALSVIKNKGGPRDPVNTAIKYGPEVESRIAVLEAALNGQAEIFPHRWTALKLLEGDQEIVARLGQQSPEITGLVQKLASEIAGIHGEDRGTVIASERYARSALIARQVRTHSEAASAPSASRMDNISLHPILGYVLLFAIMASILVIISFFGGWLTNLIADLFTRLDPHASGPLGEIFWSGAVVGFYASLSVALGFILPFYLLLGFLGESGYLPRIAFLMDRPCHTIGLHGQASLPFMLALGCNVPACLSCRIMENRRDRLMATFLTTLVPCSARTSVVLGLVGAFVGWQWAIGLLVFQFIMIFIIGRILNRLFPSTSPGIIMEIPEYRIPSLRIVWSQGWSRFQGFVVIGVPLIVAGSVAIESLRIFHILDYVTGALAPLTGIWLGLPAFTGVLFIFGILRKEAALALLIAFAGGASIISVMSPLQMVVFALVMMLYIPCISTIAVLLKETGLKITVLLVVGEILLAVLIGGIAFRLLGLFIA